MGTTVSSGTEWWHSRREELLCLAADRASLYVFNDETLNECFFDLLSIELIHRLLYPLRANPHPKILGKAIEQGLGFWCVSWHEVDMLHREFPRLDPERIVFFPNEPSFQDIAYAFAVGVHVGLNDRDAIRGFSDGLREKRVFIPWDLGHPPCEVAAMGLSVEGIYCDPTSPADSVRCPAPIFSATRPSHACSEASILIVGHFREKTLKDIPTVSKYLRTIAQAFPQFQLWLVVPEQMIAQAGCLILRVAEAEEGAGIRWVRVHGDMENLFPANAREAPYRVVNLTRPDSGQTPLATRITGLLGDPMKWIELQDAPGVIRKDDTLIFADRGVFPAEGLPPFETAWGGVPQHYLHARSMCRVRI